MGKGAFTYLCPEVHCFLICRCLEESGNIQPLMYNRALSGSRGSKVKLLLGSAPPVLCIISIRGGLGGCGVGGSKIIPGDSATCGYCFSVCWTWQVTDISPAGLKVTVLMSTSMRTADWVFNIMLQEEMWKCSVSKLYIVIKGQSGVGGLCSDAG